MAENRENLSVSFASIAVLDQRWCLQLKELQRIQNKLEEFLSQQEAWETATRICDVVLEVDEELDRILQDPLVRTFYEYDGRFFYPKHGWGFHRAFDGVHILKSLSDPIIETFFYASEKEVAIRWLMDELGKHTWVAKIRRLNWEESQTLGVLPKQVLDEILRDIREQERHAAEVSVALSAEEEIFFRSFEQQMEHW
jgi:hypothetical protein